MKVKVLRGGAYAAELARQLPGADAAGWLEREGQVLKADRHSCVALATLQGQCCYLKYYAPKSPLQSLFFRLGIGRGVKAYDNAVTLAAAGIAVPEARACLLVPGGMLLATAGMSGGSDLKALWQRQPEPSLLSLAGELLARLHRAGFTHGDCKWSNFFCCDDRLYLVDLEAVAGFSEGRQGRDLARFTVNAEDLGVAPEAFAAFMHAYCDGAGAVERDVAALMRPELERLRERHRKRYGRRGAPLY